MRLLPPNFSATATPHCIHARIKVITISIATERSDMSARRRAPSARAPTDNSNNGLPEHRAHDGGTRKKRCALRGPLTLTPRTPAEPSRRTGPTPPRRRLSPQNVINRGSSQRCLSCGSIASTTSRGNCDAGRGCRQDGRARHFAATSSFSMSATWGMSGIYRRWRLVF